MNNITNTPTPAKKSWKLKDNIFRRQFRAIELYYWFQRNFPHSFEIQIFRGEDLNKTDRKERAWSVEENGYRKFYNRKYLTEYTLCDRPILTVDIGDENTYLRFLIEGDKSNYFIVSWGYKRYEVGDANYAAALSLLIFNTCHQHERGPVNNRYDLCTVEFKDSYIHRKKKRRKMVL